VAAHLDDDGAVAGFGKVARGVVHPLGPVVEAVEDEDGGVGAAVGLRVGVENPDAELGVRRADGDAELL
jgi:hypothetical protein